MLKEKGPDCKTCQPELWPINSKVLEIYNSCASQVIMAMSGAVALNEIAVMNRIKLEGIKKSEQKELLNGVMMVANMTISLRNEAARLKQENK